MSNQRRLRASHAAIGFLASTGAATIVAVAGLRWLMPHRIYSYLQDAPNQQSQFVDALGLSVILLYTDICIMMSVNLLYWVLIFLFTRQIVRFSTFIGHFWANLVLCLAMAVEIIYIGLDTPWRTHWGGYGAGGLDMFIVGPNLHILYPALWATLLLMGLSIVIRFRAIKHV